MVKESIDDILDDYAEDLKRKVADVMDHVKLKDPSINIDRLFVELVNRQAEVLIQNLMLISLQTGSLGYAIDVSKAILEDLNSKERLEQFEKAKTKLKEILTQESQFKDES